MIKCFEWLRCQRPGFAAALLFLLMFTGAAPAAEDTGQGSGLSDLSVEEQLEKGEERGRFSDLFVKLKEHDEFARLCKKHNLDDPAAWPTLRKRFILNRVALHGKLDEAESMLAARDRRSKLKGEMVSGEETREKGRRLRDQVTKQLDELTQMLRLIDEMEAALEELSQDHALTGEIRIANESGASFTGQVLLVDGDDLILKRKEAGYFRVPVERLGDDTKLRVMEEIFTAWDALPQVVEDQPMDDGEAGRLLAYDGSRLYIKHSSEGYVREQRSDMDFSFVPYEQQLESAREAAADRTGDKDARENILQRLKEARALNQSRLKTIEWYEDRLLDLEEK